MITVGLKMTIDHITGAATVTWKRRGGETAREFAGDERIGAIADWIEGHYEQPQSDDFAPA